MASAPQLYGAVCLDELNIGNATEFMPSGVLNPQDRSNTCMPLKRVNEATSYFPDEIQVDVDNQTTTPSYGAVVTSHKAVRKQQELYAVVGDDVYLLLNRCDGPNPMFSVDEQLEELYTKVRYCLQLGVENMPFVSSWSSEVKRGDTGESDSQWRFGCYNLDNDGKLIWDDKSWVWIHFDLPEPQLDADISFCRALAATAPVRFRHAPG